MREKRESGTPSVSGSSQATALTWATSSGGKTARPARPRFVLEPVEALLAEASSPAPHRFGRQLEAARDLNVGLALGRIEDEPGSLDDLERQRVAGGAMLELRALLVAQLYL